MPQMQIDFCRKAIEIDPKYAPAHAQLAFACMDFNVHRTWEFEVGGSREERNNTLAVSNNEITL